MKYLQKRRESLHDIDIEDDPMSGIANLFDVGLVFIVALLITLFSAYNLQDLFSEHSDMTILKKSSNKELEIISKKGKKIKVVKVTKEQAEGKGERLGTAYRLSDGSTIYVPD